MSHNKGKKSVSNAFEALQISETDSEILNPSPSNKEIGFSSGTEKAGKRHGGLPGNKSVSFASILSTFYPKFENESADLQVSKDIQSVVSAKKGVLEVSVKHSGSLFMWAGRDRGAFAKNSYGNEYSAVGVWVLGETLKKAWGPNIGLEKQKELSDFLQLNRLSLAMELVTSVLGDHGQRPLQDYVVLTAVANLQSKPKFFSTPEVVEFCRKWRLPSNNYWLFHSKDSVAQFMAAYQALYEEGTAETVLETMNQIADMTIPGTSDHLQFQGNIMEGLVARVVHPSSFPAMESVLEHHKSLEHGDLSAGKGIQRIFHEISDTKQRVKRLVDDAGPAMCNSWEWDRFCSDAPDEKHPHESEPLLRRFLEASPGDFVTSKLQEVIRTVEKMKLAVRFRCNPVSAQPRSSGSPVEPSKDRFILTVHAFADSAFRRYQNGLLTNPNLWPLYRGYFIQVQICDGESTAAAVTDPGTELQDNMDQASMNLMLKMKFLPYKLRTFLIRNGLKILFQKGEAEYLQYCRKMLATWGTSKAKTSQMVDLCSQWSEYVLKRRRNNPLSEATYLDELEPFLAQYSSQSQKNALAVGSTVQFSEASAALDSQEAPSEGLTAKSFKGLLVFFPGIPGCGKSAICESLLSRGPFEDGRTLDHLMGDKIAGKFWKVLEGIRMKSPAVVTLADKNAPNSLAWDHIAAICQSTDALGVPVIPHPSGSGNYPFDLETLSVFMWRVLQRENHPGKLDASCPTACYVILHFCNLYLGMDGPTLVEELRSRFGTVATFPVLREPRAPLPASVTEAVHRGNEIYLRMKEVYKKRNVEPLESKFKQEWVHWERDMRSLLLQHSRAIEAVQMPLSEVVEILHGQLRAIADGQVSVGAQNTFQKPIRMAAISLPYQDMWHGLRKSAELESGLRQFLEGKEAAVSAQLKKAHLTLAHKRSHGVATVASFASMAGSQSQLTVTAFLYSERVAALQVQVGESDVAKGVTSSNSFPHITIWTAAGVEATKSNDLPEEAKSGTAQVIQLSQPWTISGIIVLE